MSITYKDENIKVLSGLEHVRKRPGMYIGSTDINGLHHLIWEIFDNSVDEISSGNADTIRLTLHQDNSITIQDNGRGIPDGVNKTTKLSTVDTVFTCLNAGGKFDNNAYKTSGGLHGVGASVTNALSEWMEVTTKYNGTVSQSRYENGGEIVQPLKQIGTTNSTGLTVSFLPDKKIFKDVKFNHSIIEERVKETSFLYKGLKIIFKNEINDEEKIFESKTGIIEYVEFINEGKTKLHDTIYFEGKNNGIEVEVALQYTTGVSETIVSFANSVKTKEGGSHETAFKSCITEVINSCARKWEMLKEKEKNFDGEDVREGLSAVISVKVPEKIIQYEGQTKNKLFTPEAKTAVYEVIYDKLNFWMIENKKYGEKIIQKALLSRDARIAAKKAREDIKALKNSNKHNIIKSTKLTPPQSKDASVNELFLVEGSSAGGTAKLARNKVNQGILMLRGKVINAEKAKIKELLSNEEIITIISCCGTGISPEFDITNLKYDKIIIMTDADVDGSHIQILLLTFFFRFMTPLITTGHIYIAMPPLYKFTNNSSKKSQYIWEESELTELKNKYTNFSVQRYKGLGEMNAEQLKETTMDCEKRMLIKVTIEDAVMAERRVSELMGENVSVRKTWIDNNVIFNDEIE